MNGKRFCWQTSPIANEENCVVGKKYRFTVLSSKLIRMEYSSEGVFEDRASQKFFYRDFPKCEFEATIQNGILNINTEHLTLTYNTLLPFSNESLSVKLKTSPATAWQYGDEFETLAGTYRTLDQADGEIPLEQSVCSRNGFSVLDDSNSFVLGEDGWIEKRAASSLDLYFFGFGYDYQDAVKALYKLTGAPPLLPNYALGIWWSRCHKYTQQEYTDLIEDFKSNKIPLSVAVIDFDWHIREIPEDKLDPDADVDGWTGYSWNKELFPNYKEFLEYLHQNKIKTTLNLHPADGICPHEDMYDEMATAMGIDPATKKRVPFNVVSKDFMEKYFDILHHPYEKDGVDFWWMDWQQGGNCFWMKQDDPYYHLVDLDPLWFLNHLHILDIKKNGKRPMLLSRYSGIGSHRYPVGFSGDVYSTWKNLDFQPYFTASASNIGYSWWSHDIGGFMRGYFNSELYTRWLQFSVFSPIFRIHASSVGGEFIRKEPWLHKEPFASVLKKYMLMRHELFPYIYTMNKRNHTDLEPIIKPLYYLYPQNSEAYEFKNQYFFGSELMICPITKPVNKMTDMASVNAWLPKGDWFDFNLGLHYHSKANRKVKLSRYIDEYPILAKAGAIVPQFIYEGNGNKIDLAKKVKVSVFPCASNKFALYEDGGDGFEYQNGKFVTTEMSLEWGDEPIFNIAAPKGDLTLLPDSREWNISFKGFNKNIKPKLLINNKEVGFESYYNPSAQSVELTFNADKSDEITVKVSGDKLITDNESVLPRCYEILRHSNTSIYKKIEYRDTLLCEDYEEKPARLKLGGAASEDDQELYDAICEMLSIDKRQKVKSGSNSNVE